MDEQRKHKRFQKKMLISVIYRDKEDQIEVQQNILSNDVSAGGLRMAFPKKLSKGKILDLKVFLFSDLIPLSAKGKVIWSDRKQRLEFEMGTAGNSKDEVLYWVGIQFIDIDSFTQERIIRWIKKEFRATEV